MNGKGESDLSAEVSATPSAEEEQNGDGTDNGTDNQTNDGSGGSHGFTAILLFSAVVVAVAIYYEKKR